MRASEYYATHEALLRRLEALKWPTGDDDQRAAFAALSDLLADATAPHRCGEWLPDGTRCQQWAVHHAAWSDRSAQCCREHLADMAVFVALDHYYDRGGCDCLPPEVYAATVEYLDAHWPDWRDKTVGVSEEERAAFVAALRDHMDGKEGAR